MQNIITKLTGASFALTSEGSNVRFEVNGLPSQVAQAITLLYNYKAIDWPAWYDDESQLTFTCFGGRAAKDSFKRGYATLIYAQETADFGKPYRLRRIMRAGRLALAQMRELMRGELPEESEEDGMELA
jgi:hypothetical protein